MFFPGIKRPGREVHNLHLVQTLCRPFIHLHAWTRITLLFRVILVRILFITLTYIFMFPLDKQTPQTSVISDISIKVPCIYIFFFQNYGTYLSNIIKYSCTFNRAKMVHKMVKISLYIILTAKKVISCLPLQRHDNHSYHLVRDTKTRIRAEVVNRALRFQYLFPSFQGRKAEPHIITTWAYMPVMFTAFTKRLKIYFIFQQFSFQTVHYFLCFLLGFLDP